MSTEEQLREWVSEAAERLGVPGVSVGLYREGVEAYAFHGVTSVENPLPIDAGTLFQFGSTGKTYTATTIMRLVEQGRLKLEDRVRTHVPELRLKDESVAEGVTILHLLNHTAGWSGDLMENTGDGNDALARYVEKMADLEQVTPLGSAVSYNNASLSLAGRVIEKLTGSTYEQAIKELILEPLGMDRTFFFRNDIMTYRFAAGHTQQPDGSLKVARPWGMSRGGNPAGGMSANAADQITWTRFHLGDGTARDGSRVLSAELLRKMQEPTVEAPGSAIGDRVGISWLLRDVEGVRVVSHGGTTIGQHSELLLVPERDFALISMTNSGPNGNEFNEELQRWAFQEFLGIVDRDPEPVELAGDQLSAYTGTFETIAATVDISPDGGGLLAKVTIKPEVLAQLKEQAESLDEQQPPLPLGVLPGDGDRYVVTGGPGKGMKGYFVRDGAGVVEAVHMGGRLATRTSPVPASRP